VGESGTGQDYKLEGVPGSDLVARMKVKPSTGTRKVGGRRQLCLIGIDRQAYPTTALTTNHERLLKQKYAFPYYSIQPTSKFKQLPSRNPNQSVMDHTLLVRASHIR